MELNASRQFLERLQANSGPLPPQHETHMSVDGDAGDAGKRMLVPQTSLLSSMSDAFLLEELQHRSPKKPRLTISQDNWVPIGLSPPATPAAHEVGAAMASPQTLHNNANNGLGLQQSPAAFNRHPSPAAVTSLMHTAAAGAANARGSSCFSPARPQLGSLLLVASKLAGAGGSSDAIGSQGLMGSSSRFLPATLATLQATTASVVAAEVLAAAMNTTGLEANARGFDANTGLLPSNFVSKDLGAVGSGSLQPQPAVAEQLAVTATAATAAEAGVAAGLNSNGNAKQDQQPELSSIAVNKPQAASATADLPGWLCSTSAGLAASKAICRASLLSTTAALARLNQPFQRHQQQLLLRQQQQQQQQQHRQLSSCLATPGGVTAVQAAAEHQQQQLLLPGIALGVPVTGQVVLGTPAQQGGWPLGPASTAAACHTSGRKQQLGVLDLPAVEVAPAAAGAIINPCRVTEGQQDEGPGHADSGSCTGTPKAAGAAAGAPGSVDDGTVAAAARLLYAMGGLQGDSKGDDGGMEEPGFTGDSEARVGSNFVEISRQRFVGKAAGAGGCGRPGQEAVAAIAASAAADVVVTLDLAVNKQQGLGLR